MSLIRRGFGIFLVLSMGCLGCAGTSKTVRITDAGAIADGTTLCTEAIGHAIDELAKAGGGTVRIPKGTFLTGPIQLKSHITLQVDAGAVLKFATDPALYPVMKTRYEGVDIMNYAPLISAYGCEDIKITGKGTLDGQGKAWWDWARSFSPKATKGATSRPGGNSGQGVGGSPESRNLMLKYTADREGKYPLEERVFGPAHPGFRPCLIETYECKGVTIEGVTVRESPFWNVHPVYSENVTIRDVNIFGDGPNTDGCDPDSCKNVLIENCTFNTGDDCIAIKSGRDGDGLHVNRPTENVTVRNCSMFKGHGGISIGSETSGGIRHVVVENCTIDGADFGIRVKSTRGRGAVVEDILFRHIAIKSAVKFGVAVDLKYANPKDTSTAEKNEGTPLFRNIHLEDITCDNAPQPLWIVGLPESPIENLTIKNSRFKGGHAEYVRGFGRTNVTVTAGRNVAWDLHDVEVAP